ncbi:MAG: Trk family potassium uptake protein [Tissierellia bacterium]|nr:Trk family potassium uptake protein [Tissierellia bacterium]
MKKKRILWLPNENMNPPQVLAIGFFALIAIGTVLLNTPFASRNGASVGWLNALFTATSATCVTGLTVVNTASTYTSFGHFIIMLLIQAGGLGFMTMSTLLALFLRRKITYKDRLVIREQMNVDTSAGIVRFIINVLKFTFIVEGVCALLLSTRFIPRFGITKGLWFSIFHSISAFCNAGFDLFGNSLLDFNNDWIVLLTISSAIIIGGLGFVVCMDILTRKRYKRLHLQAKLVLTMTGILILAGTVAFLVLEWNNPGTLGELNGSSKLLGAIFQSVTARTAGFNSIDLSKFNDSSSFFMIMLMFIGAGSGSTGGGIKITTFGVIFFTFLSVIRGYEDVNLFGRRLSEGVIRKSITIAMAAMFVVMGTMFAISLLESFKFIQIAFEVVSAFATVGVSQGITPTLHVISKLLIIITMFIGRLGPLTMIYVFNTKVVPKNYRNAEGQISVG